MPTIVDSMAYGWTMRTTVLPDLARLCGRTAWRWLRWAVRGWNEDRAMTLGAAIAFYALTSLIPILILTIAVAAVLFGPAAAEGAVIDGLRGYIGDRGAQQIEEAIKIASNAYDGRFAIALALATLVFSATGMLAELRDSLNLIFRCRPRQRPGWWSFLLGRLLGIALILSFGIVLLASLAASAVLAAVGELFAPDLSSVETLMQWVNAGISFVFTTIFFSLAFAILPDRQLSWLSLLIGSVASSVLFSAGRFVIGFYLGVTDYGSAWGAAAAIVALLFWVWSSVLVFLFGAELARAWADKPWMDRPAGLEPSASGH